MAHIISNTARDDASLSTAIKPGDPTGSLATLKVKIPGGTRSHARGAPHRIRGAGNWADEHKQRMQADMDALAFGSAALGRER